jgi:hypothetical protein
MDTFKGNAHESGVKVSSVGVGGCSCNRSHTTSTLTGLTGGIESQTEKTAAVDPGSSEIMSDAWETIRDGWMSAMQEED